MSPKIIRAAVAGVSTFALAAMIGTGYPIAAAKAQTTPEAAAYPARKEAPKGAPNILVIMTDDVGFAAAGAFGGPVPTPTYEALAKNGVRYNNFNTTSMCSPTRAALLTGRNSHSVGFGVISEEASPNPGYNSVIPPSAATFAQVLSSNGYDSAMFGKHHNVPLWEITSVGPFDHWPTGLGFGYFYGFLGGATNQFAPPLYEDRKWIEPSIGKPNYILDHDLADRAIDWIDMQHGVRADAPFLIYYAPGSTHSPHQAPADWIAKFKGQFDQGWDKMREASFARQKKEGIIPPGTALTPRPNEIPAWSSLSAGEKRIYAHMMEIYAAQLAYSDHEIGRIIQALKDNGEFDNTLIVFIQGDNGGSLEGSPRGTIDEIARGKNHMPDSTEDQLAKFDQMGTAYSWDNYPVGWAWAMNTPFQWGKAVASHLGGVRNDMVVSWPGHTTDSAAIRQQFAHVTDIAPTLYDAAGITPPDTIGGVKQQPFAGVSLIPTFTDPKAQSAHDTQYFELRDNIAFYDRGWLASTKPRVLPWQKEAPPAEGTPVQWELYNLNEDFSQSHDISARYPEKLEALKAEYRAAAARYNVGLPAQQSFVPRPFIANGQTHYVFHNSEERYSRYGFPSMMNRSWTITASIVVPDTGGDGALVAQGGALCGWSLLILDGKPTFLYNASIEDRDHSRIEAAAPLSPGAHRVTADFAYDGGGYGKGGNVRLLVDGKEVAQGRVPRTPGYLFVSEGGASIGRDYGTPLTSEYSAPFAYPGTIDKVTIDFPEQK